MARVLLVVLLCIATACASGRPKSGAQSNAAPETPTVIPPPDPARGQPVVWVNGLYRYADDLKKYPIEVWVGPPLIEHFAREHKLEPTDDQVDRCIKAFAKMNADDPHTRGMTMPPFMAHQMVRDWLIDKTLYEKYGGTVIFQQANPMEPVGAYRALFEEAERLNHLKFFDKTQHDAFWAYYLKDHSSFQYEKKDIDFSKPWWEQDRKPDRQ